MWTGQKSWSVLSKFMQPLTGWTGQKCQLMRTGQNYQPVQVKMTSLIETSLFRHWGSKERTSFLGTWPKTCGGWLGDTPSRGAKTGFNTLALFHSGLFFGCMAMANFPPSEADPTSRPFFSLSYKEWKWVPSQIEKINKIQDERCTGSVKRIEDKKWIRGQEKPVKDI